MPDIDLPARLDLPLQTGEPWWYWLGGRPALDFLNTLRERWRRRVETLVTPEDLGLWLVRAELVERRPHTTAELLEEAQELREAIDACAVAAVAGRPLPARAVRMIDRWLVHAAARPQLSVEPDGRASLRSSALSVGARPGEGLASAALGAVAFDAARMLGTLDEVRRMRICASETCSARFYDRSPAAGRRWCSMSTCGNEAKARRLRARRRESAA